MEGIREVSAVNSVDREGDPWQVFCEDVPVAPITDHAGASVGGRVQWPHIVVFHSFFGSDCEFSVVLQPFGIISFQPDL